MDKVTFTCGYCNTTTTKSFKYISEVIDMKCPKCGSNNIWINNIEEESHEDFEIILGRGGCSQK